jgi:hypothetical protein
LTDYSSLKKGNELASFSLILQYLLRCSSYSCLVDPARHTMHDLFSLAWLIVFQEDEKESPQPQPSVEA